MAEEGLHAKVAELLRLEAGCFPAGSLQLPGLGTPLLLGTWAEPYAPERTRSPLADDPRPMETEEEQQPEEGESTVRGEEQQDPTTAVAAALEMLLADLRRCPSQ